MNVDPVTQELNYLRKQVLLLQAALGKYRKGIDVIKTVVINDEKEQKQKETTDEKENQNLEEVCHFNVL